MATMQQVQEKKGIIKCKEPASNLYSLFSITRSNSTIRSKKPIFLMISRKSSTWLLMSSILQLKEISILETSWRLFLFKKTKPRSSTFLLERIDSILYLLISIPSCSIHQIMCLAISKLVQLAFRLHYLSLKSNKYEIIVNYSISVDLNTNRLASI